MPRAFLRAVTLTLGSLSAIVWGASPARAQPTCAGTTLNGHCVITINREVPASPVPVRVTSSSVVTVQVSRRPLEKIVFLPGLQGLVHSVRPAEAKPGAVPPPAPPPAPPLSPAASSVKEALAEMDAEQRGVEPGLADVDGKIRRAGLELRRFRETPAGSWSSSTLTQRRTDFYCAVHGPAAVLDGATCPAASEGAGTAALPVGVASALDVRLKEVVGQYAALSPAERALLASDMDMVAGNQGRLKASLDSLRKAQEGLVAAAVIVKDIVPATASPNATTNVGGFSSRTSRTATIKIAAQDLITKESTNLATVVIHFGGTRWEVSGGAMFSAVRHRTFENAPIIVDGVAQRDDGGKIFTRVVETQTRPVVVPAAFAHYRLWEGLADGPHRAAVLLTGVIGINPHAKSADMAVGGSLSYRGLMVSPLLHWVRDIRLTNGLEPGQELGTSPPALTTERHWVRKLAIGLSYRIPF
jgi:hypothetical protein